jgi:predicted O-linked N-acetylglucosamine transferase (SPINDLY family)/ADP-heptose:LPS heptosyltransferase
LNARIPISPTGDSVSLTETLPLDHWTNFFKLAQMGMLRIDQLFQKTQALVDQGMQAEAVQLYLAYATQPASEKRHMALYNLGSLQQAQGDMLGAEASYRACIALDASLGQAAVNLGLLLEKTGRKQEALEEWHKVANPAAGSPSHDIDIQTMAWNHIGRVYENHKQYDEAERALERSLALNTKQTGVLQHWIHIRQKACAWPVYKPLPGITHNDMLMATSPLAMLAMTDDPVQQLLTAHAFVGRTYGFKEEFLCKGRVYTHDRIRIGYVSGDLCTHAVGLLLPEVFESHDRTKFEVYAYDFSPEDGTAVRARLKASFDHMRRIDTLTDRQVAELVLQDEIDVLIDLHGLSSGARPGIFALHPAPKQGTYLGFIGTTGMPWFDFVIADKYVLPEELTPYFTEKPLYTDDCFIPLTQNTEEFLDLKRSDYRLKDDAFVMAAFGNVYKITPEMFTVWLEILKSHPNSILWLVDDNKQTTHNLKSFAHSFGIEEERIVFTPRANHQEYKSRLKLADVFLDTYPYNCGSTSNDVIQAGLDLVTLCGKTMVSRMGFSILNRVGKPRLVAKSFKEYKDIVDQVFSRGKKSHLKTRILVIRQLALGDVLLATPIVRKLYSDHDGHCIIDVITKKPEVFVNNPWVKNTYTPDAFPQSYADYDKIINLDLTYEKHPGMHIIDAYSMHSHGHLFKDSQKRIELNNNYLPKLHLPKLLGLAPSAGYAVIHMRHDTWPSRNLSVETWRNVVDIILSETDLSIIQVGSPHEISFDHDDRLLNHLGKYSIHELKTIIEHASVYVGIDSGTLHIAATTDIPIISFFTSAHHDLRKPLGRIHSAPFFAVTPILKCYGCQARFSPPITGVICDKGDPFNPPCISSFDLNIFKNFLISIL